MNTNKNNESGGLPSGITVGGKSIGYQVIPKGTDAEWWRCYNCGYANPRKYHDNKPVRKCQNCNAPKKEDDKE